MFYRDASKTGTISFIQLALKIMEGDILPSQ